MPENKDLESLRLSLEGISRAAEENKLKFKELELQLERLKKGGGGLFGSERGQISKELADIGEVIRKTSELSATFSRTAEVGRSLGADMSAIWRAQKSQIHGVWAESANLEKRLESLSLKAKGVAGAMQTARQYGGSRLQQYPFGPTQEVSVAGGIERGYTSGASPFMEELDQYTKTVQQRLQEIKSSYEQFQQQRRETYENAIKEKQAEEDLNKHLRSRITEYERLTAERSKLANQAQWTKTGAPGSAQLSLSEGTPALYKQQRFLAGIYGGWEKANQALKAYNVSLKDLKSAQYTSGGGTVFNFEKLHQASGLTRQATVELDKFNQVINRSSGSMRGMNMTLADNIVKVLRWSVAVGVVYGAFNQLSTSVQTLRDMDEAMSNIALSTGLSTEEAYRFFDAAVVAAEESGTTLEGVMNIYDDALRATRSIADEQEKFAVANSLVADSLTYSRLTGVDAAQSMDVLIGALRQLRQEGENASEMFNRSGQLLDAWVYISQRASVSVDDLAQTFAVTGAAAESANISMYELSGFAASLSESTLKSARETGNTIRRLITQTVSETGINTLKEYGIAVEKTTGELRDYMDVMREIAVKYQAGVLSESALRDISYSIAGGARGAADFVTTVKSMGDILGRAADAELNATGSAMNALQVKTGTLNTAVNELSTAFNELVTKIGVEGGLVESMTDVTTVLSTVIKGISELTEVLGPATTRLVALGATMALITKYGPAITSMAGRAGLGGLFGIYGMAGGLSDPRGGKYQATGARPVTSSPFRNTANKIGARIPGGFMAGGAALAYAGIAASGEETTRDKLLHGGAVIGGAVISTLLGGSPMIGAVIGDAASQSIIKAVDDAVISNRISRGTATPEELEQGYDAALEKALKSAAFWPEFLGGPSKQERLDKVYAEMAKPTRLTETERAQEAYGGNSFILAVEELKNLEEQMRLAGLITPSAQRQAGLTATAEEEARNRRIVEYQAMITGAPGKGEGKVEMLRNLRSEQLTRYQQGDITRNEYKQYEQAIDAVLKQSATAFATLEEFDLVENLNLDEFIDILAHSTPESINEIMSKVTSLSQVSSEILTLETEIAALRSSTATLSQEELDRAILLEQTLAKTIETRESLKAGAKADVAVAGKYPIGYTPYSFPGFTTPGEDITSTDIKQALAGAEEDMAKWVEDTGDSMADLVDAAEPFFIYVEDGFMKIEGITKEFFDMQLKQITDLKKESETFNLERLKDIGPEEYPGFVDIVRKWEGFLNANPEYAAANEPEPFNLIIGEDPQWRRLVTTQEALRYAIEELTDVEKKQLEGMWNIPEGASVMVPLTSLYYANKGKGEPGAGGMGFGEIDPSLQTNTAATDLNTAAINSNTAAIMSYNPGLMQNTAIPQTEYRRAVQGYDPGLSQSTALSPADYRKMKFNYSPGLMQNTAISQSKFNILNQGWLENFLDKAIPIKSGAGYGAGAGGDDTKELLNSNKTGFLDINSAIQMSDTNNISAINTLASVFSSGLSALVSKPQTTTITVNLDGRAIAKQINRYISEPLHNAARNYGYSSGGLIGGR